MASSRPDKAVVAIDRERPFAVDELFFSTTDAKGVIRSGNDVFVRVSGYEREQLVGQAHNIIRHPDMPRGVFEIFWDHLGEGTGVAAYVKNMAADGSYYWVLALAVPISGGYLSVRMKPSGPLFDAARSVYADALAVEREVEDGDVSRRKQAIEAGAARTLELLAEAGFPDYRSFMRAALVSEVASGRTDLQMGTESIGEAQTRVVLGDASAQLGALVQDLRRYGDVAADLSRRSQFLIGLAGDIRLFALNAVVTSARIGARAAALGTVAQVLGAQSRKAEPEIRALHDLVDNSVESLGVMQFRIAASKLITDQVFHSLPDGEHDAGAAELSDLVDLGDALADSSARLGEAMDRFYGALESIETGAETVARLLSIVQALEINGRVEGARLGDAQVSTLFGEVGREVAEAVAQLRGFQALREQIGVNASAEGRRLCVALNDTAVSLSEIDGPASAAA